MRLNDKQIFLCFENRIFAVIHDGLNVLYNFTKKSSELFTHVYILTALRLN